MKLFDNETKKRVIFSLYINIPKEELDLFDKHIKKPETEFTNINTKNEFETHYQRLIDCKKEYADKIGVDFFMHEEYKEYYDHFQKTIQKLQVII